MLTLNVTGNDLNEVLAQLKGFFLTGSTTAAEPVKTPKQPTNTAPAANTGTAGKVVAREDIRAAWAEKKDAGVPLQTMKDMLASYGVAKLDLLGEEHFTEALAKVLKFTK